jgi:hypothetical protein
VSELHKFDRIFVARPLAQGWLDKGGPSNWFEVQDWQTEMWFSASYKAEVDALNQINGLVHAKKLQDSDYREVKLIEIAPETPAGFFIISSNARPSTSGLMIWRSKSSANRRIWEISKL